MKKKGKFEIGSKLKHIETGVIIELLRYDKTSSLGLGRSQREGISKAKTNFRYLYGKNILTGKKAEGLTRKFELSSQ